MKSDRFNEQENKQQIWFNNHYSKFSDEKYSLENWRLSMLDRIFSFVPKNKIKYYLDIGCGATGYTVIEAAKRNNWLSFGVDISLEAMLKAKALAQKNKVSDKTGFLVCSAEHLPFKKNVFDYVSAISLLEHLEEDKKTADGIVNKIKKGGYLYICVPNTYVRMWPFLWPIYKYLDYKIGHKRHYSIKSLTKIIPKIMVIKKILYNGHLIKLFQLLLDKLGIIDDRRWWTMEAKDIDANSSGIQLNVIYQKSR
ncbi:MAG: class I SAM-dependent methyltransferase [bacterium]|nr:class I SAM-dependent methyltransferase [bacterium]